ncbi:phospholipase A1 [Drosophila willistoni]|nr:phospholipase A1 [Drosophila willistoni]
MKEHNNMTLAHRFIILLLLAMDLSAQGHDVQKRQSPIDFQDLLQFLQDQLRQLAIGVPLDISFSALNYICSTIVDLGIVQSKIVPDMSKMSFQLHTDECHNVSVPLTRAEDLWQTPGFQQDRPMVIFITGWTTNINNSNSGPMAKAYQCRNDTNFVILDASNFIDTLYTWSALNTEAIGAYVAKALVKLNRHYITTRLHVIGHSLGAQIAGSTGRNYKALTGGEILTRITGLDPANPCFYDGNNLLGVRSGDARFVDIIHTNPGILGTPRRQADADFFVQGLAPFKSGCAEAPITCSHNRAVDYFVETVYPSNANDFLGKRCTHYADLLDGRNCRDAAIMGFAANYGKLGMFYVDANGSEPYGKQASLSNYTYTNTSCGVCTRDINYI